MTPIGHAGLTLAAGLVFRILASKASIARTLVAGPGERAKPGHFLDNATSSSKPVGGLIVDYRFLVLGSILPDLIDKPLSWFLPHVSGRNFGHTTLFQIVLLALGVFVLRLRRTERFLVLAIASAGHLLLDRMWEVPNLLLWPLKGLSLYGAAEQDFSPWWIRSLYDLHLLQGLEALSALVLLILLATVLLRGRILQFLRTGVLL